MRRPATLVLGVVTVTALTAAPALAARPSSSERGSAVAASRHEARPPRVARVELVGVLAGTPATATVLVGSDPATATPTVVLTLPVAVKGGARQYRGDTVTVRVPRGTPVQRNGRRVFAAALRSGDRVEVRALRTPDGVLYAERIEASSRGKRDR